MYTFEDGHIYYNNEVIKIRYDLINSVDKNKYGETQIFDHYCNIFQLKKGLKIMANTPLCSIKSHKFVYTVKDQ